MDLKQIRTFLALYEEGSVTRAAQRLHVVQPAVSMQIRKLETDNAVALFTRTSQGLKPTPFAVELYKLCCRVASDVDRVDAFLADSRGRLTGEFTLGVPPSLANAAVADLLLDLRERTPGVKVRIQEGYSADLEEWLVTGQIDIAVMTAVRSDERLQVRSLLRDELVLAFGRKLELPSGDTIPASALAELPLVLPTSRNTLRAFIDAEFGRSGIVIKPELEVDSLSIVISLLEAAALASVLPAIALTRGGRGSQSLLSRRIVEPALNRELVLAQKASRDLGSAAESFAHQLTLALQSKATLPAID